MTNPDEVEHVAQAVWVKVFQSKPDKLNTARHIAQVAVDAHHEWGDDKEWRRALQAGLPQGLCGNRDDHEPHEFVGPSHYTIWCHADQTQRLPFAAEMRRYNGSY